MPCDGVLLFEDETMLRWLPPLRFGWGFRGEQIRVPITGQNAKRTLFGVINPRTGHRLLLSRARQRQEDFQAFLRLLRQHYGGRPLWLLLDKGPCHTAPGSEQFAARLEIELLWLPKQCSELNAMDQLWRELKRNISANRQFSTVDEQAEYAQRWVMDLTPQQARRKAGILADNYWLKRFL